MARSVFIAIAQTLVVGGDPEANLGRAVKAVQEAGARHCDAVVLPECLDLGWTHPSARVKAEPIPGRHSKVLADAARAAGVWLAAGLVERAEEGI